ncbi:MAG: hypothetical protein MUC87_00675 [Bacteroidia bacterium]|jgi:hypothetical protein|nr:hypothetical protein [Bacteroidia bacterium]
MSFRLVKYYHDIITPQQQCFIGYAADIELAGLRLAYNGHLHFDGEKTRQRNRFGKPNLPDVTAGEIRWRYKHAIFSWTGEPLHHRETLYRSADGEVVWECLLPNAAACTNGHWPFAAGRGYCEKLSLTLPPWKLPVNEIYWGRFTSATHAVVWIEWRGTQPLRLLLVNEQRHTDFELNDNTLRTAEFELHFTPHTTLRSGAVADTVFKPVANILRPLIPFRLLRTQETKWLGTAQMRSTAGTVHGQVIYERVCWR